MIRDSFTTKEENSGSLKKHYLENGQIEEIHTMPKKDYYASLRIGSNLSITRNVSRASSISTLSKRTSFLQNSKSSQRIYKPSGKMISYPVLMLDGEEKLFEIDVTSLGEQLFNRVTDELDLIERDFFGIKYTDKSMNIWFWLKMDKKISEQLGKNDGKFEFQVKFYEPHVNKIQDDLTRYLFCLQIRRNIIEGIIPVSFSVLVLLGAYAVQSEAGDHDKTVHDGVEYIRQMAFAPKAQQTEELLKFIANLHKGIGFQSPEEADKNFMWNATKLGMYGIDMHTVKRTENDEMNVGVYHSGIVIYRNKIRVIKYSWPRIIRLAYKNKSFFIMLRPTELDKRERNLEFKCVNSVLAKRLWLACAEHHSFFRMVDAENPGKPRLVPGFGVRKFRLGSNSLSVLEPEPSPTVPQIVINRQHLKIKRMSTLRKDRSVILSSVGMAPVAFDDVFLMEENENVTRPELETEYGKMTSDDSTPEIAMDTSGLDVVAGEGYGWQGTRSNKGVKGPGKYYYEGKVMEDGLARLGWSTNDASLDLGSDIYGFGYGSNEAGIVVDDGFKRNNNEEKPYGQSINNGDLIGCSIDFDNNTIQWSKNGTPFEVAYIIPDQMKSAAFFPASSIKDGRVLFNFGDVPMEYMPKGDWGTLSDAPTSNVVHNKYIGWRMNPLDVINGTEVSENGLLIQSKYDEEWYGCRANKGLFDAGKYYYEVIPLEEGLARVGWATDEGSLYLGRDVNGFGYGADDYGFGINHSQGKKMNGNEIENYGDAFSKSDVIGCFLDLDNRQIKWSKNGQIYPHAYLIPDDLIEMRAFYPTASLLKNTLDFNFGNKPFSFYPGSDWTPVCYSANGNTESSKKQNSGFLNRTNSEHYDDVLLLRRTEKEKLRIELENRNNLRDLENEKKNRIIKENERIEMQEKERRLLLQKDREERERKQAEIEREIALRLDLEEAERRPVEEEHIKMNHKTNQMSEFEEHSETIIKEKPEISTETYVDEQGRTVTKILRKMKTIKVTNVDRSMVERTEDELSHNNFYQLKGFHDEEDDDDDELLRAIMTVTKLSGSTMISQSTRHMSISMA